MISKKINKICWVTSGWFIDVDLPIVPELATYYQIHWIIVLYRDCRFTTSELESYKSVPNLNIEIIYVNQRARHPKTILNYFHMLWAIRKCNADVNYVNMTPASPYILLPYLLIPSPKTIFTAHDGNVKSIMHKFTRFCFNLGYGLHSKYIHMYSLSQAKCFQENFVNKRITIIPLALKDYGCADVLNNTSKISFLSFGTMHAEKNIGLLIRAAEDLYEEGYKNFVVSICGSSPKNWDELYGKMIKHPSLFNLQLRMINNAEIPNLFASHMYAVYPYKAMSQSGALKVAFAYHKPVIVSNLDAFKEEVVEGTNGFFFESNDINSLKNVMRKCICREKSDYLKLLESTSVYVQQKYSNDIIKKQYLDMFENMSYAPQRA